MMSTYDCYVFFVSSKDIHDVAKRGEGISATEKDLDLDAWRSSDKYRRRYLQKHWSNAGESSLLPVYRNEKHAYEVARQRLQEGKEATIVVIYMGWIVGQGVEFRDARKHSHQLDVRIPNELWRYSESQWLVLHHIPEDGITEIRQVRQVGPPVSG